MVVVDFVVLSVDWVDCVDVAFWSDCGIDEAGAWVVSEDGVDGLVVAGVWLVTGGLAVWDDELDCGVVCGEFVS